MSRKLTTYTRPPIRALLATTGTIESLAAMREEMRRAFAAGEITPSPKTVREWSQAMWVRVLELMELYPDRAPYIYNVTLTWPKPHELAELLEATLKRVTAPLPPQVLERHEASKSTDSIQGEAASASEFGSTTVSVV